MQRRIGSLILGCLIGSMIVFLLYNTVLVQYLTVTVLPDGGQYVGERKDNALHGKGRIDWPSSAFYEGSFENGVMQGNGYLHAADGSTYEGQFENGMFHGDGIYQYKDMTYKGAFQKDKFEGYGEQTFSTGDRYIGEFKESAFHGKGEYIESDGQRYQGQFVEGQFTGHGIYDDGDGMVFEGQFKDWMYGGLGEIRYGNGEKLVGDFSEGSLNGSGEYFGDNGSHYKGEFENGAYHGYGEYLSPNGDVYKGEFKYGLYHGQGELTYHKPLDGMDSVEGLWRRGRLSKCFGECSILSASEIAEISLYNQNELLETTLGELQAQDANKIDMYFLGVAGHGSEAVFRREVLYVKDYFDRELKTANKSIALVNDRSTIREIPLATETSIKKVLNSVSNKLDPEEDILFVFLSSHGSKSHQVSIDQPGLNLENLSAESLAKTVKALPVKWKVIVVSACYSGGHIPNLEGEHTMVITAADKDRESFGCSDENEFTYFGEAFFKDSLPGSSSFIEAFEKAKVIVSERELENEYTPSNPQISASDAIKAHLAKWRAGL